MELRAYESVFKAAADPTRVRILKILEGGEMCVCQVIAILSLGQSTVSKHLFLLRSAGLIKDRRDRKWVHYSLDRGSDSPYAARSRKRCFDTVDWPRDRIAITWQTHISPPSRILRIRTRVGSAAAFNTD